ncbi:MAG TPA: glycosyltransferase family 4 protein [Nitrolancea sp.]|nr:glycosyltransferase family 4 protein [Nitrolancea sp.]
MRIAQIAPLAEAVPPKFYGGTERVVAALVEELVDRGHEVTLFASGDSETSANLVPVIPEALRSLPGAVDPLAPLLAMLELVEEHADAFDLIHSHVDYLSFPFTRHWRTPTITTLHGRLDIPELPLLHSRYPEINLISISDSQRLPLVPHSLNWIATVYNGIVLDHFSFQPDPGDYLVFLGRISKEKRPDLAVEVARRCGIPLKIAAKVDPAYDQRYLHEFEPLLDDPNVEFLGEVDEVGKNQLLRGAMALLFPSLWPEPFGMAMVEAMACGVPVIGLRYGAVPEVIIDGQTGFICDSVDEMVASVKRLREIDRATCRRHVEANFSARTMTDGYEAAYNLTLSRRSTRRSSSERLATRQDRSERPVPGKRHYDRRSLSLTQRGAVGAHGHHS